MSLPLINERNFIRDIILATKGKLKAFIGSAPKKTVADKLYGYGFVIFYSNEDECWVADVPDLKYCSAFGDTPQEAAKEIQIAIRGWLESALEGGIPIPKPRFDARHINFRNDALTTSPKSIHELEISAEQARQVIEAEFEHLESIIRKYQFDSGNQLSLDDVLNREGSEHSEREYVS